MLWKRGEPRDRERARSLGRDAIAAYRDMNLPEQAERAADALSLG